jgi:hypothetical protein
MTEIRTRDFSRAPRKLEFSADGETYECHSAVPPVVLQEMLTLSQQHLEEDFSRIADFFDLAAPEDVAARIRARLTPGHKNPLDLYQSIQIVVWLIEEYGQRPTTPSVTSTGGSQTGDNGTSSTDGVLNTVSIL